MYLIIYRVSKLNKIKNEHWNKQSEIRNQLHPNKKNVTVKTKREDDFFNGVLKSPRHPPGNPQRHLPGMHKVSPYDAPHS
jgi:hypothetical protein